MGRKVYVVGVGMTKFEKPGSREWDYPDMAQEAGSKAIKDAGIRFEDIEQAAVGYCYGDSTCGQRAFYELGHSGIPIHNVNNNCATASTALFMGKQFIEGGVSDCVMALGFEKMEKGSLCFSCNEMLTYEALGLCEEGKGGEFVDFGAQTYGGKVVVNPSGGLISKGHPLGPHSCVARTCSTPNH